MRQRADRYNNVGAPKSNSSIRTIPLDDELIRALATWKVKSVYKAPDDFVFCMGTGHIEHHANMLRSLEPTMKTAETHRQRRCTKIRAARLPALLCKLVHQLKGTWRTRTGPSPRPISARAQHDIHDV